MHTSHQIILLKLKRYALSLGQQNYSHESLGLPFSFLQVPKGLPCPEAESMRSYLTPLTTKNTAEVL